jgi:PhnB protein
MQLSPYLTFNGGCETAFKFYEQALGGKITFKMTWGEAPVAEQFPTELHNSIMHMTLAIGDYVLMGADAPAEHYKQPQGINVSLHLQDVDAGKGTFNALAEGGTVVMPFAKTFWSPGFGMCVDRFGIPWMVNCGGES